MFEPTLCAASHKQSSIALDCHFQASRTRSDVQSLSGAPNSCQLAGMEGKDGATGRKSIVTSDAPRRQSCILQENGRKEATAGLVPPSSKVGRLSQVP